MYTLISIYISKGQCPENRCFKAFVPLSTLIFAQFRPLIRSSMITQLSTSTGSFFSTISSVGYKVKISCRSASSLSFLRAIKIRLLPRSANAFAVSYPMPELAPVITVYLFVFEPFTKPPGNPAGVYFAFV